MTRAAARRGLWNDPALRDRASEHGKVGESMHIATFVVRALVATMVTGLVGVATAQEPIRVGAFLSVTGPAAFLGDPEQKTLELYIERLNAGGGVLGRKLPLGAYRS